MIEMATLIFPFVLGLFLVFFQPIIDVVCANQLVENAYDKRAREAAEWTSSVSAFLPAAALTLYGAFLVMSDEGHEGGTVILIATVVGFVATFLLFLHEVATGKPSRAPLVRVGSWRYTRLQCWLAFMNVVGVSLGVWYHLHPVVDLT